MKMLPLAALLLPLACSSSTEPGRDRAGDPRVNFVVSPARYSPLSEGAAVHTSSGTIEVTGDIVTGDPCVDIRGGIDRVQRRVSITVTARRQNVSCIQVVADFSYRATIEGLEAGQYDLVVAHAWEDPAGTRTSTKQLLATTVAVP
jgi:hypothetical protein